MKKLTILYTPQCPSNLYFVKAIRDISVSFPVEIEEINVHNEHERAKNLMEKVGIGYVKHLFIRVFLDGELLPAHPGNPEFEKLLITRLERSEK